MNKIIELRYAVLTSLVVLLWLSVEYVVGLQDKYISWYPLATLGSIIIPFICYNLAFEEKERHLDKKLATGKMILSGLLLTLFTGILALPVHYAFIRLINPDFVEEMIRFTVVNSKHPIETVVLYLNVKSYIVESCLFTLVTGIFVTFILALRNKFAKS